MVKELSIYDELSNERKELQEQGKLPKWCTTIAWQMLKEKNLSPEYPDLSSVYNRIAKHAASYTPNPAEWQPKFFELLWNGLLVSIVLFNAGLFILTKMISKKAGVNMFGMMNNMNRPNEEKQHEAPKRKMKGPDIDFDNISEV